MNPAALAAFVLLVLTPGAAAVLGFRLLDAGDGILEGLAKVAVAGVFALAGFLFLAQQLAGLSDELLLAFGFGSLAVVALLSPRIPRWRWRPDRAALAAFALLGILGLYLLLDYAKYPLLPAYRNADFTQYLGFVTSLHDGARLTPPLYYGVDYFMAALCSTTEGTLPILACVQQSAGVLVVVGGLEAYLLGQTLTERRSYGLLVLGVYVVTGSFWFPMVFEDGFYANFLGVLACELLIVAVVRLSRSPSWGARGFLLFAALGAATSHFSVLTAAPALLAWPFLCERTWRRGAREAAAILGAAGVPALVLYPGLATTLLKIGPGDAGAKPQTLLSSVFSWPSTANHFFIVAQGDLFALFLVLGSLAATFAALRSTAPRPLLLLAVWALTVFSTGQLLPQGWRYPLMLLPPLAALAPYVLLDRFFPAGRLTREDRHWRRESRWIRRGGLAIVLFFLLAASVGATAWTDVSTQTSGARAEQFQIVAAVDWLGAHTTPSQQILSVSDWRPGVFCQALINRTCNYGPLLGTPAAALSWIRGYDNSTAYIMVTNNASSVAWVLFNPGTAGLSLAFNSSDVQIYGVPPA